jgi:hypothetical protein
MPPIVRRLSCYLVALALLWPSSASATTIDEMMACPRSMSSVQRAHHDRGVRTRKRGRGGLAAVPEGGEPAGHRVVDRSSEKKSSTPWGIRGRNGALWVVALVGQCS